MGDTTEISWCDKTFNPWIGCQKVSPACANCYAEREFDSRLKKAKWGPNGTRVLTAESNWKKPLRWERDAKLTVGDGPLFGKVERPRVFCASLADVFEDWKDEISHPDGETARCSINQRDLWIPRRSGDWEDADYLTMSDMRSRLFKLIDETPSLDWLLLTKRPENIIEMWPDDRHRSNVWLGCSVENQEYADKRIPELVKCRALSPVLFLSCEPLLGHVNLPGDVPCPYCQDACADPETGIVECATCDGTGVRNDKLEFEFDWVIAGGESGPNARPSDQEWFRSLRDQCKTAGVPFHFKQFGEHDHEGKRVGKKAAGRALDGVVHNAMPVLF